MATKADSASLPKPEYYQGSNKKIGFILNPAAQGGKSLKIFKNLFPHLLQKLGTKGDKPFNPKENNFNDPNGGFITLLTTKMGDAWAYSEELINKHECDVIVAIGGDGTINEVINGYMNAKGGEKGVRFAVLPIGTGGDFKRTLGISNEHDAIDAISEGIYIKSDIGRVECVDILDEKKTVSRYFINECGAGISGAVCDTVNKSSKMFGALSFYFSTIKSTISYNMFAARYRADGGEWNTFNLYLIEIGNGKYGGGGMKLIPEAEIYDHLFHVTVLYDVTLWEFLTSTSDLYKGNIAKSPHYKQVICSELAVEAVPNKDGQTQTGLIETEGEVIGKLPCTCKVIPFAVNLIVPKGLFQ